MSARLLALLAAIFIAGAAVTFGQQGLSTHTLLGTVTDAGRRPLPRAVVELSLPASTGSVRTVTTSRDGTYRFDRVVPGLYVLTVRLAGFGSAIRDLEV